MRFFFDEHMPIRLVRAVAELAHGEPYQVVALRDRFPPATKDIEWLPVLGNEGDWSLVTEDRRIRTRPHEAAALRRSALRTFFLAKGWNQEGLWGRAALLITWWPTIVEAADKAKPGQMFEVPHRRTAKELRPI